MGFWVVFYCTKNEIYIKNFFSKCYQIRRKLRIWSNLLNKSLTENFIFCAMFSEHHGKTCYSFLKILWSFFRTISRCSWIFHHIKWHIIFWIYHRLLPFSFQVGNNESKMPTFEKTLPCYKKAWWKSGTQYRDPRSV